MKILELRTKTLGSFFACFLFPSILGTVAVAQNGRTFVSGGGADTNPCSVSAPCDQWPVRVFVSWEDIDGIDGGQL
jgi:hypothetical protein